MRRTRVLLVGISIGLLFFRSGAALVNDANTLYVGPGESFQPTSEQNYYNVSVTVKNGGTIFAQRANGGGFNGKVDLVAPRILVEGSLIANACGYDTRGQGGSPSQLNNNNGGGGGGFGGAGGRGAGGGSHGVGGGTYDTTNLEDPGSFGYGAAAGDLAGIGYGGGSIRLDALSVTVAATAKILAKGNTTAAAAVGGGSGGSILVNGVHAYFVGTTYILNVSGGLGGAGNSSLGSAGGGGGGRVKIYQHNPISLGGAPLVNGGAGGGGAAAAGAVGSTLMVTPPLPNAPLLLLPTNGAVVGLQPTFMFVATDPGNSKFLDFQIDFSCASNFSSLTFTVNQLLQDPGWGGKAYYNSGEVASYTLPSPLATSTTYYWRVRVTDNLGQTWSTYSTYWVLTTTAAANLPPLIPQGLQPAAAQTLVSKTPCFQVLGADPEGDTLTFAVILATNPTLQNAQMFQAAYGGWDRVQYLPAGPYAGVTATCQVLNSGANLDSLTPGENYYWKVVAYDFLQQSAESGIYHFSTAPLPLAPALVSPSPGSVVTTRQPLLQMQALSPSGGSLAYKLELSSDGFQTELLFASQNGGWSKTIYTSGEIAGMLMPAAYPLLSGTVYQWRGVVYDLANDNWSLVSPTQTFTVITPPLLPNLIFPEDNYSAPNAGLIFRFSAQSESGNTLTARLDLSRDNFQSVMTSFDQSQSAAGWSAPVYASGAPMQFCLPASVVLARGPTYWWRVQATDGISWGPLSEIRAFSLSTTLEIERVLVVPNPAVSTSDLQLQILLTSDAQVTVRIFNKLGKKVGEVQQQVAGGTAGVLHCDISQYASGVYFYRVEANSGLGTQTVTKKFAVVK